ncbi:MAG TPA: SHD1 domain-containing protein [Pirellulales bacterium]
MNWAQYFLRIALTIALAVFAASSRAADTDKAMPKVKVGDTVEVKDGDNWVRGTVLEFSIGDRIKVKTDKFTGGWPYRADEVRPLAKKKPPADDDTNPFATPEEKTEKVGKRTWSDRSGKFKIEATIARFDSDKVVLKRTDGKEVSVPVERLSPEDQKIIVKAGGPTPAADGKESEDAGSGDKAAPKPAIELTETDLSEATPLDVSHTDNWTYKPDVASKELGLRAGRLALGQRLAFGERAEDLLISPSKQTAFVVFKPGDKRKDGTQPGPRIVACDLAKRKVLAAGEFHSGQQPLDLSEDGTLLLARASRDSPEKGTVLTLYALDGFEAKPKLAWKPYAEGRETREVSWAGFIDSKHVLTMSDRSSLVMWDLTAGVKPVYRTGSDVFGGASIAFSPNKKYLAMCDRTGAAILEPLTGAVAGHLSMSDLGFRPKAAFRDDGRKLAIVGGSRVRVWDLDRRQIDRDFSVDRVRLDSGVSWADDDRLISSHGDLIDVERRIVLWKYQGVSDTTKLIRESLWTVSDNGRDGQTLIGARLPHEAARSRANSIKPNDILVIKPGMDVSLEMQFVGTPQDQETVHQALLKRLTDNGMKVVPQSNLKLVAQIKPGKAMTIAYRTFGSRNESQYSAMSQVMELSYVLNGQPVWTHKGETSPPHILHTKKGQTIDQALADHMRVDPKGLGSIYVPSHITRPLGDEGSRTSPLPGA